MMLRPISAIGSKASQKITREFIRNKIVEPSSLLNKADRLKLWHRENKELFGPLLESNKEKKRRLQKAGKFMDTILVSQRNFTLKI